MEFRKRLKKTFLLLCSLFFVMFFGRLGYSYLTKSGQGETFLEHTLNTFSDVSSSRTNIASYRYLKKGQKPQANPDANLDQKYEKTANVSCKTSHFEEEEKSINVFINQSDAIIQLQRKSGVDLDRRLFLQIGVPPEKFNAFVQYIQDNYQVTSLNVSVKDKTNEYRELNSRLATLRNTRASLSSLKNRSGKIEEYIELENRILEIDQQLQCLGVQLGVYDSENEFCTVNLTLTEGKDVVKASFMDHVTQTLEWTIQYYLMLVVALFFTLGAAFVLLVLLDRLKIIAGIKKHFE